MGTFTFIFFCPLEPINVFTLGFSTGSTGLQFCSRSLVKERELCVPKPNRDIAETVDAV